MIATATITAAMVMISLKLPEVSNNFLLDTRHTRLPCPFQVVKTINQGNYSEKTY